MTPREILPDGFELKNWYPVKCPCGHSFQITPSIIMRLGLNSAAGSCARCREVLHFTIALDNSMAVAELMSVFEPHEQTQTALVS